MTDFDQQLSLEASADAQARVDAHASEEWKQQARRAIELVASALPEFTTDDVWQLGELAGTRENRALGPVMSWAVKQGWIADTGRVSRSRRVSHHANPKRVWRSILFERLQGVA